MKNFIKRITGAARVAKAGNRQLILDRLEDRALFDAAAMLNVDDLASIDLPGPVDPLIHAHGTEASEVDLEQVHPLVASIPASNVSTVAREVAFVDAGVPHANDLVEDLRASGIDVHLLNAAEDGLHQIADIISGYDSLDAVHIVSHGLRGELLLGNAAIGSDQIGTEYADALQQIGAAISADGDILLYGCNLAASEDGRELLQTFSDLTGADVAGSNDLTGHASLGGDWELEFATGSIAASFPFSQSVVQNWNGILAAAQTYYVPLTEEQIYESLEDIFNEGAFGPVQEDIVSTIAITATQDGTVIYYDHHEDGYEANTASPTQGSTLTWGDGDLTNGIAPGTTDDLVNAGDVIALQNTVPIPSTGTFYDGGDKFVTNFSVASTRAGWSPDPGTVLAGTVEVTDTSRWGDDYIIPVGEDTANTFNQYEYVGLFVMAQQNGTVVNIDTDADGVDDITVTLAEGESYQVDGGILQGATVTSSADVQVDLITGDRDSAVDSRWYLLRPVDQWSNSYVNPVGSTVATDPASIVVFNPNATAINVDIETQTGITTIAVPAGENEVFVMPVGATVSGAFVTSQGGEDFYAVMSMDSDAAHAAFDWGFSLLAEDQLTSQIVAGWAPGSEDLSANGSPVWVTSTTATDLYVDYDGDPTTGAMTDPFGNLFDVIIPAGALESVRVTDPNDNDQSGMRVYTVDGSLIAGAWGLDADLGGPGLPFLDLGTLVLPFPVPTIEKTATLTNDVSGNGLFDPGDTVTWTITVNNHEDCPLTNITISDDNLQNSTYVPNTTIVDGAGVADDGSGTTAFPLDEGGLAIADIMDNTSATVSFDVVLDFPLPEYTTVENVVTVDSSAGTWGAVGTIDVNLAPNLFVEKNDGGITTTAGGSVAYEIDFGNLGTVTATGVVLTEELPANATFDAAGSTGGWTETVAGSGIYTLNLPDLAPGDTGAATFAVFVDDPLAAGIEEIENSVSIADDGTNGPDSDPSDNMATDDTPVTAAPDLFIQKGDGVSVTAAGNTLTYRIRYGNDGSQGATGVVITETLPAGTSFNAAGSTAGWTETASGSGVFEFNVGALPANELGVVAFSVIVDDPLAAGIDEIVNNVSITDDGTNGVDEDPTDNQDDDMDTVNAAPDLYVTKDDGQTVVSAGGSVSYSIMYGNDGSQGATGVVLTETIPAGVTFDAASSSFGWTETSPGSGVYELSIGNLMSGQTGSVTFAVTVDDPLAAGIDQLVNNVTIGDDGTNGPDEDPSDNSDSDTDTVVAAPDLVITKDDGGVSTTPGGTVVYTLNYSNIGSQDATGVVITEMLPANTTFNAGSSSAGWTETSPGSGIYQLTIGALDSGDSGSVDFAVTVDANVPAGFTLVENETSIADDGSNGPDEDPSNNDSSDDTPIAAAPDLVLTKDDGQTTTTAGGSIVYAINYSNVGNIGATGVVITETLPAGTMFDAGNSSGGWVETAAGSGIYELTVGSLAAGGNGTVNFAVIVDDPVAAGLNDIVNSASIADDGANGADPTPGNNSDDDTDVLIAAPDLYVTKDDGQTVVSAGGLVSYSIMYGNDGSQDATGVVLTETLPAGMAFDAGNSSFGWAETAPGSGIYQLTIGNLMSGQTGSVTFAVTVDDPLAAGIDQLVNDVTIADDGANGADEDPTDNQDDDTDVVVAAPDLVITKDDGGVTTTPGGTVVYTLNYSNVGSQDATGVVITEMLPANTTFNSGSSSAGWVETTPGSGIYELTVGALDSGDSGFVDFAVTVDTNVPAGFTLVENETSIADDGTNGPDENPGNNDSSDDTPIAAAPDLVLTKDDGQTTTTAGGTIVYAINYSNVGNIGATGVVITETLPTGTTFDAASSTPGWVETAPGSGIYEFMVGSLAASGNGTVNFAVIVDDPVAAGLNDIVNSASIADDGANGADPTPGNNSDTDTDVLNAAPDLYVTKDDGQTVVSAGGSVTYSIMYGNDGSQDATGVVLTETVPAGMTFDAASSSFGWTETAPGSGIFELNIGNLMSGQMGSVSFAVTVDDPLAAGIDQLVNNVEIADDGANGADEDPTDNQDDDTDIVNAAPDLVITKDDGGATTTPGGTVVYTLSYSNIGSQDATGVVITEMLPANTTFNSGASSAGWVEASPGSGIYELTVGALDSGDSGSVDFAVTVDATVPTGFTLVENETSIADDGSNGQDEDPTNNDTSDDTPITAAPDLVITKDDGGVSTTPGGTVVYTLNYSNIGSQGATGVVITETLPANTTFDPGNSSAGWVETSPGSGVYELTVGALDVGDSGTVDFAVTVDTTVPAGFQLVENVATIADDGANGADENPANNTDNDDTSLSAGPDLYVTKDDFQSVVFAGDQLTYSINYGNEGAIGATGVVLTETLPAGTIFNAAASTVGWSETAPGSGIYELNVGSLPASATGFAVFSVNVENPLAAGIDQIVNSVEIADDGMNGPEQDTSDNMATDVDDLQAAPDLYVSKDDGQAVVFAGQVVTYTIDYGNAGSQAATGVVLTETIPAGVTFNAAGSTGGWTETSPGSGVYELAIGGLDANMTGMATFSVTVDDPLAANIEQLLNNVEIADDGTNGADEVPQDNQDNDTDVVVAAPDLVITKDDGGVSTTPGGTVVYTLNYSNIGSQDATGVVITEMLPANTTFDPGSSSAGWVETSPGSGIYELTVGALNVGDSGTVDFAVTVDVNVPAGFTLVENDVTIADDGTNGADEDPTNNASSDDTPLAGAPDLVLIKDDGQTATTAGGSIVYTLNYENVGNIGATGVVITETLPAGTTFDASNSSSGWVQVSPGVYELTVGSVAAGGMGIVDFAVVVDDPVAAGLDSIVNAASIADDGANGADPTPGNNSDDDTDVLNAAPDLYVTKDDGQTVVSAGGDVSYTIMYGNDGSQGATGVVLTEALPAGMTFDAGNSSFGWTETAPGSGIYELVVGDLMSGQTGSVTFAVTVDDPLAAGIDQLVNDVTIADDGSNGADEDPTDNMDDDTDVVIAAPDLVINKDDGGASTVPGGTVVYTINYSNIGSQGATGVVVTETLPANTTFNGAASSAGWVETAPGSGVYEFNVGGLNVGDSGTVDFAVTVDSNVPAGFVLVENDVTIADDGSNGPDEDSTNNDASDDTPIVASVDLVLTKDDGQTATTAGGSIVYTLNYENVGNIGATGVVITETLPAGTTFDATNSSPGWVETAPSSGIYELTVGSLAAGGTGTVDFAVIVDDPVAAGVDEIVNSASIADDGMNGADPTPGNNSDDDTNVLNAAPDLYVTKDDGQTVVSAGGSVTYTIMYGNDGSQDATGVVLTETIPAGMTFDAANSSTGWAETAPGSGIYELTVGNLMSGQTGSVTFAVTVDDPLAAGIDQLVNDVTIADDGANGADEDPTDNQDDDTDTVTAAPDLVVTKDDGGVSVGPGGTVIYTLDYSNIGSQDATGVVITETLPANTTFSAANSSAGWVETAPGSGIYEFAIGALDSGDLGTVDFAVTVDATVPAGFTLVENTATIADDGTNGADEDPSNNDASDDTPLTSGVGPDLYIAKDDFRTTVFGGDGLVYSIDYGNEGVQGATGVVIRETLPAGTVFSPTNSSVGWVETAPGSGIYEFTVGTLNAGATGFVQFAVTVDNPVAAGIEELVNHVEIFDDGANGPDVDPSDNSATDVDTVDAAPDLFVAKDDGQAVAVVGETLTYVIEYGNNGTQNASGVIIRETIPAGVVFNPAGSTPGWTETAPGSGIFELSIGTVAVNALETVEFSVIVDDPLAAGISQLVNHVEIMDDGTNGTDQILLDNEDTDTDTVIAAPDLVITKDDGGVTTLPGDTVVYTLSYSNIGSQGATGVVVTENLPANTTFDAAGSTPGWVETAAGSGVYEFNVGAVASGDSGTVDFAVTVDSTVPAGFSLVENTTSITDDGSNGNDEDPTNNNAADDTPLTGSPDLYVDKDDFQSVAVAGDTLTYTINYGNEGTAGSTGVVLTETLPAGTAFNAAASAAGWAETAPGSGIFELSIGALASGEMGSTTFAVDVNDPLAAGIDQVVNSVSIADDGANGADSDPSDNTATDTDDITAAPDLFILKDDGQSLVAAGDTLIYTIEYGNDGSQDATGVVLTETIPAGVAFDAGNSTAGWTETAPGSGIFELAIGDVASGDMQSVTFAVTVDDPLAAGIDQLLNNVSIADDGANGPDEDPTDNSDADADTVVAAPDLVITKDDGGVTTAAGGTVVYTLSYSNIGSQDATGVIITENLPANTTFNAGASDAGWIETSPGIYSFDVGALASGDSGTVDFAVTVDSSVPAGFVLVQNDTSIADDGSNGTDEDPTNNDASDDTPVDAGGVVDLVLTKDDGQTLATAGGSIVYTLSYGNVGTLDATGVVISEILPVGTSFDAANSDAGWVETAPGSGNYELTLGGLAAGASGTVDFAIIVDDPVAAGLDSIVNAATIADDGANGPDATPENNADNDIDELVAAPDLYIMKDDALTEVVAGDTVIYTIEFGNDGSQDATGVVITEILPSGATFNATGSDPAWMETSPGSGVYELAIGNVASGDMGSVTFAVTIDSPLAAGIDQLVNNVAIADDGTNGDDEDPTDNFDGDTDTINAAPDLVISKDDGGVTTTAGGTVVYTLNYSNIGSQGATGVVITENLPANTTFDATASTPGWVETSPGSGVYQFSVGALASGDSGTVDFAVAVDTSLPAGFVLVQNDNSIADDGTNGADEDPTNNDASDDTPIVVSGTPDLFVTKDDNQSVVVTGDTLIYMIEYGNLGTIDASGVILTETLPAGVAFDAGNSAAGWTETSPGSGVFELAIGDLMVGETRTVAFAVTVNDPLAAGIDDLVNNVSIADDGANGADSDPTNNSDDDTDVVTAAPDLVVTKDDGGVTTIPGGTVVYTLTYSNTGSQDATGVLLTETLPANTTYDAAGSTIGWTETTPGSGIFEFNLGALASGDSGTVEFAVTVDTSLPAGFVLVENVTSIADDGTNGADEDPTNNDASDDTPVNSGGVDLALTKDDGATTTTAGGGIVYTLSYENLGNVDASGVVITETLPTGATFDASASTAGWTETSLGSGIFEFAVGDIVAGGTGTVDFAIVVNDPVAAGQDTIVNTATIADDGANGQDLNPNNNSDDDTDTLDAAPDLYVTKDDGETIVQAGNTLIYTITYGNDGSQDATGVSLTETLPAGVTFDAGASSAGWTETAPGSGVFELAIGDVPSGDIRTVTFAVTVDDAFAAGIDELVNNVTIADDGANGADEDPTDNSDNDTDQLIAAPDLVITKDDGGVSVTPGGTVTYTLTYTNVGSQDATGVVITETLPANTSFDAGASAAGWTETAAGSGVYELAIGDVAVGETQSVTFAVTVDSVVPAGFTLVENTTSIADDGTNGADEDPTNNSDNDDTPIVSAVDLVIAKSDGDITTTAGGSVVYTIEYSNVGNIDATGVVVTEQVPVGSTFDANGSSAGWVEASPGVYEFAAGGLASGESRTIMFAVVVDDALAAGFERLDNTATIADDGTNGADANPGNNSTMDETPVTAAPDLYVVKDDGQTTVSAGGLVTYSIEYGNDGSQDATGVVLTETLPAGVAFDVTGSTAGWTETAAGSGVFELAIGDVPVGDVRTVTFAVVVNDPMAAGIEQLVNNVVIADDGTNGADEDPTDNQDSDTDTVDAAPDLYVTKDDGQTTFGNGDSLVYTITYGNDGSQDATGVVLTETLPIGTTFDPTASTAGWVETSPGSGVFTFAAGDVPVGETRTIAFAVVVDDPFTGTSATNLVEIADDGSNGADEDPTDNMAEDTDTFDAPGFVDYVITKDNNLTSVSPGESVTYTITVQNIGNVTGTGVTVVDAFPAPELINIVASDGGVVDTATNTIMWNLGNLDAGETVTLTVTAEFNDHAEAGVDEITNTATVSDDGANGDDPNLDNNSDTDTDVVVATPDYVITKDDGLTSVTPGGQVTYTITVSNVGNQDGTGVVVTDNYPNLLTTLVADNGGVVDTTNGTVTWNLGALDEGETVVLRVTGEVIGQIPVGVDSLTNTVSVTDDGQNGADPTPGNNTDDDTDTIEQVFAGPDLAITKTDNNLSTSFGDTIFYQLTVTNNGDQTATGVHVHETVPNGTVFSSVGTTGGWQTTDGTNFEFEIGDLAVGETRVIEFAVQVVDADVTVVNNTATVDDDGSFGADPTPGDNTSSDTTPVVGGTIAGLSFDDANGNGVFDPSESPISGVVVNLAGFDSLGNSITQTTTTDAAGNYVFSGLPAGLYTITQQQPVGFIDGVDTAGEGGNVTGNDEIQVQLASGQSAIANNFGEVSVQPGGNADATSKRQYLASTATGVYDGLEPVAINDGSRFSRLGDTVASASGIRVDSPVAPVEQPVEQAPAAQRVGVDPTRDRDESNDDAHRQVRLDDQHSPLNEDMLGRFRNWVSRSLNRQR